MKVEDLMTRSVGTCGPTEPLSTAARLMWDHDCGCVAVVSDDGSKSVVGMLTDCDICMATHFRGTPPGAVPIGDVMSKTVRSIGPSETAADAEAVMRDARVRRLPVVDEKQRLVGLISLADLARAAAHQHGSKEAEVTEGTRDADSDNARRAGEGHRLRGSRPHRAGRCRGSHPAHEGRSSSCRCRGMRVVLVEARSDARADLVAALQRCRIAVASFGDPRTAFFFLLARVDEVDGVLVNGDEREWSSWLRRLEMASAPLPIVAYSGRDPEREARITRSVPGVDSDGAPQALAEDLGELLASMAGFAGSSRALGDARADVTV